MRENRLDTLPRPSRHWRWTPSRVRFGAGATVQSRGHWRDVSYADLARAALEGG